jgi:hypothetical protein
VFPENHKQLVPDHASAGRRCDVTDVMGVQAYDVMCCLKIVVMCSAYLCLSNRVPQNIFRGSARNSGINA